MDSHSIEKKMYSQIKVNMKCKQENLNGFPFILKVLRSLKSAGRCSSKSLLPINANSKKGKKYIKHLDQIT